MSTAQTCEPYRESIVALRDGRFDMIEPDQMRAAESHLNDCAACQAVGAGAAVCFATGAAVGTRVRLVVGAGVAVGTCAGVAAGAIVGDGFKSEDGIRVGSAWVQPALNMASTHAKPTIASRRRRTDKGASPRYFATCFHHTTAPPATCVE